MYLVTTTQNLSPSQLFFFFWQSKAGEWDPYLFISKFMYKYVGKVWQLITQKLDIPIGGYKQVCLSVFVLQFPPIEV